MSAKSIRILIVDDHAMVRQGLSLALNLQPDLTIVGEAGSGSDGVILAQKLQPDVILLDLNMPDLDGLEVMQRVRRLSPHARVLILSGIHADARVFATIEAGVDGYIVKDATTTELAQAIRNVAAGDAYLHPLITRALTRHLHRIPEQPATLRSRLTARELSVLQLMATSATNRAIAGQLSVSEETVRSHVKNILRKLDQPNRTQAVLEGIRRGLISPE
ncbi:MAG: response regulator transcription factor [Chloroflexota bacterium]